MADFISGQDLVARGAEGTGAAVVLDNKQTIQNLARLGGRMDNLYKTQEMLKMKMAAAKAEQAKPPKQPPLNPFATGGITGEYLGAVGNQFMQSISAIKRSKYNQKLGSNDIAGANQEAADAASALATLNPTVQNLDLVMKKNIDQNKNYYQYTGDVIQKIQSQFPTINAEELSKISDPIEQEKYIMNKYNNFLQSDANTIVNNATLLNPESYNYNGVFQVINENIKDRTFGVRQGSGKEKETKTSEFFVIDDKKGTVSLDYNKAINAINQLPKARAQVEVLQKLAIDKAVKETKDSPVFATFTPDKQKIELENAATKAATKAERQYAKEVFRYGLTADQKINLQTTEDKAEKEAKGARLGAVDPANIVNGVMPFSLSSGVYEYVTKDGKTVMQSTPLDYTVSSKGTVWQDKEFTITPNSVMIPIGSWNEADRESLGARKYQAPNQAENNLWKQNVGGKAKSGYRVDKMPVFTAFVQDVKDPTGKKFFKPGQFVPDYMIEYKTPEGKSWLDPDNYIFASGYIASPEVDVKTGVNPFTLTPTYEKKSTTENFYLDQTSSTRIFDAMSKNIKGATPQQQGDIFSTGVGALPAQSSSQSSSKSQSGSKQEVFWRNPKTKKK
jgi:hypothetical protein